MTNEQIERIYNILKEKISVDTNEMIETENAIFQITTLEQQKDNNNPNVSTIDLGDCEDRLKKKEGLNKSDNLIIYKIDIKNKDLSSTYVQYEIYNPKTLKKLSLDICSDLAISVNIPVHLDKGTQSVYDSLSKSGYNLFNLNDSFYTDICSTYTSGDGTDLTLLDRKKIIYDNNGNVSMCQEGCYFQYYNLTTKKAKCDCVVQTKETITDIDEINFNKDQIVDSFFSALKNSNFLVLKCYKLVFSKKGQIDNKGSYMMSAIFFIFIILMIVYIINGNKKINYFIQMILNQKLNYNSQNRINTCKCIDSGKNSKTINLTETNRNLKYKKINNSKKEKGKNIKESKIKKEKKKENNNKTNMNNKKSLKKSLKSPQKGKKYKNVPPKRYSNLNTINNLSKRPRGSIISLPSKKNYQSKSKKNLLQLDKKGKKKQNKKSLFKLETITKFQKKPPNKLKINFPNKNTSKTNLNKSQIKDLNDEELNNLEYELAIAIDKRNYFQYYYSLLKKKQLLLFAFYPSKDYNLVAVKISLLLLSFSLYFAVNGFFFTDDTMNKIYEDKGTYDILYQIPIMLYSTIISSIINMLLKTLSLSQRQILSIKLEKDFLEAQKKSKNIKKYLQIKLGIFFIFSLLLMIFFWYFISCFCAVYKNTQLILIEDTLLSFALSMIYPFGLNFLPGIFRISALRAPKKDKKCLYKISGLIALI